MADAPISVNESPIPAQAMSALRVVLISIGTALTSRGVIKQGDFDLLQVAIPALFTLGIFGWSQWATRKNAQKLAVTADAAPNTVAVVK